MAVVVVNVVVALLFVTDTVTGLPVQITNFINVNDRYVIISCRGLVPAYIYWTCLWFQNLTNIIY